MVYVTHPTTNSKTLYCPHCGEYLPLQDKVGKATCPQCEKAFTYHRSKGDKWVDMVTWRTSK